jgi:O-antigen ligase
MRNHWTDYPLGENMLTLLLLSIIVGALVQRKRLPRSNLYFVWLVIGVYLYISMWLGAALGNAPAPLWTHNPNFSTWKSYMIIPLLFVAASLVIEDRKHVRTVILITAISVLLIDRACILESLSRTWTTFDEDKRDVGPLAYGSNQTAAYLANFAMFYWGFIQFVKTRKYKLMGFAVIGLSLFALMFTFSRGGYLAFLVGVLVLGLLKDRKLLVGLGVFLFTWQLIVPNAVRERVTMTKSANGYLDASAQSRIDLLHESLRSVARSPIVGNGYATFQFGEHAHGLDDTHDWYLLVMVEQGVIGLILVLLLMQQVLAVAWRVFKRADDPLYRGLGLGILLAMSSSIIANIFGDRWTYIEISGPIWVLIAATIRANQLMAPRDEINIIPHTLSYEGKASVAS